MNLLVTGGAGFIGVNFIRYLLRQTDFQGRCVNLDKLTYAGNLASLVDIESDSRYHFEHADICDRSSVERIFDTHAIDTVCHLAAESHVDRSILTPGTFIETNVYGTWRLLEAAKRRGHVRFHHVSTDEVYGSLEEGHSTEGSPYSPSSPYSASKASSNHLVNAYHKTYGLPVTTSNSSNNYGPYQFPEKLIPLSILNLVEGRPTPVYGDGLHVRNWLLVEDHCEALWRIINEGEIGQTYNVSGRDEMTNIQLVGMLADLIDEMVGPLEKPRRDLITLVEDRPGHDRRYAIDTRKIESELGFRPRCAFEDGLRETLQWYLNKTHWIDHVRSGEYLRWLELQYAR